MTLSQSDYVSVAERAHAVGCALPAGLAFLPENFETLDVGDTLRFRGEATTVAKLLRQAGLPIERLGEGTDSAFIHNRSYDWALPIIFISAELMKQSPDMVGMAIDVIRDYVVELFAGSGHRKIKTEIVIEDQGRKRYRKITYEGDAAGLGELAKMIKHLGK